MVFYSSTVLVRIASVDGH